MNKHTAGPWTIKSLDAFKAMIASADGLSYIADVRSDGCGFPPDSPVSANARLIAAAPEMFVALAKLLCPSCDHELQHHADKYGCEIDRGDGYRNGSEIEEALGPCGCSEDDLRDDYPDFVRAIAAFKKAKGAL